MIGGVDGYKWNITDSYDNNLNQRNNVNNKDELGQKGAVDKSKTTECQTCKNRKYQDGSDEMVSFKSAAHVSPQAAAGRVRAHEGEHVSNAYDKAAQKNGTVVYASVSIHTSVCRNVEGLMFQAEQQLRRSAIQMRITLTRKTERPQMQLSFRGQILTLPSEVRKGDLLL